MRIGIDARFWNQTGIGRYTRNLCINLSRIDKKNNYVLFVRNEDKEDAEKLIQNKNWKFVSANIRWHSVKEQLSFSNIINKEDIDLMHFPYFSVPFFYNKPYVVTIHDLILHHFVTGDSSTLPLWAYGFKMIGYKIIINNTARKAKKIIAVSGSTLEEIFDHLMANKNKIEVIYEAADDFKGKVDNKNEYGKFFLFVGNVYPHKNAEKLIKAFNNLVEKNEIKLFFIGREDYFYKKLKKQVPRLEKQGKIIFKDYISDDELANYYRNAVALVRPSLMEGFSLPPLEAMESEGLVIASDIPVHREILEDGVIYFNPSDTVDIEEKMKYALSLDKGKRLEIIKRGKKVAEKYSWEKTAKKTLELYESISSKNSI